MNNLAELLSSPPDEISELNGVELVRQKVAAYMKKKKGSLRIFFTGGTSGDHGRSLPRRARVQL